MSRFKPFTVSKGETGGKWSVGDAPFRSNKIYGVDPCDGSPQLVAEVYGYSHKEVEANAKLIVDLVNYDKWKRTP